MGTQQRVWSALAAVYILWGATYLGMAIVVEQLPPLLAASSRFLAAGLIVALVLGLTRGFATLRITRRELLGSAALGVLLLGMGNGTVMLASRYVPSSMSALLVASVPLWIVLLRFAAKERPAASTWAGVACGFAGVVGLVAATGSQDPNPGTGYIDIPGWQVALWLCAVMVGSMCWSVGSFIAPKVVAAGRAASDPFTGAACQFLAAGLLMGVIGLVRGEDPTAFLHPTMRTSIAWIFILIGGVIAYSCYVWLLQNAPVSLATTYAYVNPVVAVFLGWLILSEPISPALLAVGLMVVAGVALVVRGEKRPAPASQEPAPIPEPRP